MARKLYRSRTDRMIWGVCGGLAAYFNVDPTIVRVIAVLSVFISGLGILAYLIMAIFVPLQSSSASEPKQVVRENVEEMKTTARQFGEEVRSGLAGQSRPGEERAGSGQGRSVVAAVLIIVGVIWLLSVFRWIWLLRWSYLLPIAMIAVGIFLLLRRRNR